MSKLKGRIPGLVISVVLAVITVLFLIVLVGSQMLPTKMLLLGSAAILLIAAAAVLLVRNTAYKVQFVFGTIIAVVLAAVLALGGSYLQMTMNTLTEISNVRTQYTPVGLYVRVDDPAESVEDVRDYSFGILETLDRENTDSILAQLSDAYGVEVTPQAFAGMTDMVDSLLNGETGVIVLNTAYVDVLTELSGYEDIESQIRELDVLRVEQIVEETTVEEDETVEFEDKVYTIYISGSDSREGLNSPGRSDVNILATVNTETRQVLLVTTPRDYYVPLSISGGVPDKLTHAGIYGVDVSIDTLEMLYETEIDYYFRVDFTGFKGIVDALGGITVQNDIAFSARGYDYPVGTLEMEGDEALQFARERKSFVDGDIQRGKNQLKVITAVIDKALSPDILMKYTGILESVEDCFQTNLPYSDIAGLVRRQLEDNRSWNIVQYSVSGTGDKQIPYSMGSYAYVMQPDYDTVNKAIELINKVQNGEFVVVSED